MNTKVSVIVPVYGTEQYLRKCLDSLIGQTLQEIEIIVINDGSPDNSQVIIEEYERKCPKVRGIKKENGGMSSARNAGIQQAKGEYIAFVDSDDYIEPEMCQVMYEKACKDSLDIVECDTITEHPTYSYIMKGDLGYTDDPLKSYIISYPNPPARLIRTALMKEHLFREGLWYEDLELMPCFAVYTDKIGFIHQAFYHYVQRSGSVMHQKKFNPRYEDIFCAMESIVKTFQNHGVYEQYKEELEYLFIVHLQRSAILRFAKVDGTKEYLSRVDSTMKQNFPKWNKNIYFKKSSWKFKLICLLGLWKQYWLVALLRRFI